MRIFREFFFVKSTVEEKARNSWGRYRMAKVMAISIFDTFEILSVIAMMNPLITMQDAEATKAKINLVEKKPSFGEIGLHSSDTWPVPGWPRNRRGRRKVGGKPEFYIHLHLTIFRIQLAGD